jgi:hypothetical protein
VPELCELRLRLAFLLRVVGLLVAEDVAATLADLVGRAVGLLVEAASRALVDRLLTLGERLVRSVAEPFSVHVDPLLQFPGASPRLLGLANATSRAVVAPG